jgi:heme exporter protein C
MNRTLSIYALFIVVLLGAGVYEMVRVTNTAALLQRIASYQLALSVCAFMCFFANFVASIRFLIRRRRGADALAVAAAEIGLLFCCVLLATGALSSHRLVAVWWTWSTTRTAALLLGFVYASYLILRRYANMGQASTLGAVLGIFAFADIPLTYVSIAMRNAAGHVAALEPSPSIAGWRQSLGTSILFCLFAGLAVWLRFRQERLQQQADDREAFAGH